MLRTRSACFLHRLILFLVLASVAALGLVPVAKSQTPEQLEIFRTLPPEQQRAILDAMQGTGRTQQQAERMLQFPETVQPRSIDPRDRTLRGADERESAIDPRFKANDTLILELELMRFEDQRERTKNQTAQPQRQAGGSVQVGATGGEERAVPSNRVPIVRAEDETEGLRAFERRVERRNPYVLDKWGILNVPELGPVPLSGLTAQEAQQRLEAEGLLREFVVNVIRLPLDPTGVDALRPFGYDLFAGYPTTFAPATDVPVPTEYVLGPGDVLEVQLIGNTAGRYSLVVGRDGRVSFPELGPIAVSGRRFAEVRDDLERRVQEQMIGTRASVTIGELRSIRVFVLGDAQTPGSYTVSGLSTITHALYVSGGVKEVGSLRNVQLKRGGRMVATLDLYDLLLRGDTSADLRLLPGDVVFVPPVGVTAAIAGEVRRPAIYELKGNTDISGLIELAGGLTPQADPKVVTLERINERHERVTVDLNLERVADGATMLRSGDVIRVSAIRPTLESSISLQGHVYRPGHFEFREGMRLLDVISSADELMPNADLHYVLVRRELPPDRRVTVFSADLEQALADPSSAANFELAARDRIHVFDLESGRDRVIYPLMRELELQSHIGEPTREVSVSGQIKIPGRYPLEFGMRLTDLLRAGGGPTEAAFAGTAEITRYTVGENGARTSELIEIELLSALNGNPDADIPLRPFDHIVVKEIPLWSSRESVEVRGEVRFPGRYPIKRGETLASLLRRAGGLTEFAFSEGAVFTRRELQEREREQIETLARRMQGDLAQLSLHAAQEGTRDAGEALSVGQALLASLRETEAVGRLVIDLDRSMHATSGSEHSLVLKDGDKLIVPRVTQEVTVLGEVQSSTSHLYSPSKARDAYIAMSGGLTPRADKKRIYVVRANGSVETRSNKAWFRSAEPDIRPGDTIVVPLDTERMRPLPFWQAVTQVIYNLAVSVAAVNSF